MSVMRTSKMMTIKMRQDKKHKQEAMGAKGKETERKTVLTEGRENK